MGYTLIANSNAYIGTNTDYRAWGSMISNGLANSGFIQTADTGQVNWTTASSPATGNTYNEYEIWRFNDALQASIPVYMKLSYGAGQYGNTVPGLYVQLGSGSTGNGELTGWRLRVYSEGTANTRGVEVLAATTVHANNTLLTYISGGDGGRFCIAWGAAGTGATGAKASLFSIERTVDSEGNPSADGVLLVIDRGYSPQQLQGVWSPVVGTRSLTSNTSIGDRFSILMPGASNGTRGSNTSVYPIYHDISGGAFLNPGLNLLAYYVTEFTANTNTTISYYGTNHTYMPLGNTGFYNVAPRSNNQSCLMIRWE